MRIVVTGSIGIGKTTLCQKVADRAKGLGFSCGGVLCYKAPDRGIMVVDVLTQRMERLASVENVYDGPRVGKYHFSREAIAFGNRAIARGADCDILFLDEVGPLELAGRGFISALEQFRRRGDRRAVMVVRNELLPALPPDVGTEALVLETTQHNRNALPDRLCSLLFDGPAGRADHVATRELVAG